MRNCLKRAAIALLSYGLGIAISHAGSLPVNLESVISEGVAIRSVAISPDGQLLATARKDGSIRIYRVGNETAERVLRGHGDVVNRVVFSPDGKLLASGSDDSTARLWDVQNWKSIQVLKGHAKGVQDICFSPDGLRLATASADKTVKVWDPNTGQEMLSLTGHEDWVDAIAFSPDGRLLVSAGEDGVIKLWDPDHGDSLGTLKSRGAIHSIAISSDGRMLAGQYLERRIALWDLSKQKLITTLAGQTDAITSLAFSPRGELLASGSADSTVRLWDWAGAKSLKILSGHRGSIDAVAFFPNGWLVSAGQDATVRIYSSKEPAAAKASPEKIGPPSVVRPSAIAAVEETNVDTPPSRRVAPDPSAYAIVIGIATYKERSVPRVDFAARDAETFRDYLVGPLGFDEGNVILLRNDGATKGAFDKYLGKWLFNHVDDKSRVIIYFAGHGAPDPTTGAAYLVPFDADPGYLAETGYPLKSLYESLSKLPTHRVTVFLDSCFSGSGGRSVAMAGARPLVLVRTPAGPENVVVISASQGSQISLSYTEKRHGLFSFYLFSGLKGATDADHDGRITLLDAMEQMTAPEV
jgi:hypothetical protein